MIVVDLVNTRVTVTLITEDTHSQSQSKSRDLCNLSRSRILASKTDELLSTAGERSDSSEHDNGMLTLDRHREARVY